ncbi:ROK family transcriptional regulator [Paenibacillus macerans]|uniref:ROK family transcriptional regulator n=1 Tax=Paenibacillus macerans TaxID=44252 RepID=UPI001F112A7B|nr:ROK family transcriptional regulator [Paenibacillus macerans]UMV48997.1 ROK family transcriptional regulator [Paenibacillus macerans]
MKNATIGNPQLIRSMNETIALEFILQHGRLSRADLSRITGLSKPTVSSAIANLLASGLIREVGHGESGPGRKPTLIEFNGSSHYALAAEIAADHIHLALSNLLGETMAEHQYAIRDTNDPASLTAELKAKAEALLSGQGIGWNKVIHMAIGVPAVVDEQGELSIMVSKLRGLEKHLSKASLARAFPCRIILENDVNLAALAEFKEGAAAGSSLFAYLSLDAGIGAGLMIDGKLLRGLGGAAGEFGEMLIEPDVRLEERISEAGLFSLAEAVLRRDDIPSVLRGHAQMETADIFAAARSEDPAALQIIGEYSRIVARGIHNLCVVLAPRLVVLGGSIGENGEVMLPFLKEIIAAEFKDKPELKCTALRSKSVLKGAIQTAVAHTLEYIKDNLLANKARDNVAE